MADLKERVEQAVSGRYYIEKELGRGGMAVVYLAEDLRHHRRVALKVLDPEVSAALSAERFEREIEIASHLTHPHILALYDSGEADGLLYYVMPFVEGESLRQRLQRERQLPLEDTLRIAREVADALAYAHARGIVHRDIKPENILIQGSHALVCDFGIARALGSAHEERLTGSGLAVGSPAYMSPEQAAGESQVDARSDVYSLGCVVYEMLSGEAPYPGATPQAIFARKMTGPPPRLAIVRNTVPAGVEAVVVKSLAMAPADRYANAGEFRDALDRARSEEQNLPARSGARRRRQAVLVAVLLAVLAGTTWWATSGQAPHDDDRILSLAVLPFENLSGDSSQEYFVDGMHDAILGQLAQLGSLRVISRTSVLRYRNTAKSVREIAADLDVDGLLEGSVLRAGDSVRIQVQLVRARPQERQLWAHTYDRDMLHVLAMHSDVARSVAREVAVELSPHDSARLATVRPVRPEAYEAYLKGTFYYYRLTRADLDAAEHYFQSALRADPNYALAYAGMSSVWGARQQLGYLPSSQATPRARAAALKAIALDSTLGEAHARLAAIATWSDWDWATASREFKLAMELGPHLASDRASYSHFLNITGRQAESMAQIRLALQMDPFNPLIQAFYASLLTTNHRDDEALAQFRKALALSPSLPNARNGVVNVLHSKGRYDESVAQLRSLATDLGDRDLESALIDGYAKGGYRGAYLRAADLQAARARKGRGRPLAVARLYSQGGDKVNALYWLEQGYEQRDPNMPYIGVARAWDNLRDEPRFQSLLERMKLPR